MRILWEASFLMEWALYCNWTRLGSYRKFKKDLCLAIVIQDTKSSWLFLTLTWPYNNKKCPAVILPPPPPLSQHGCIIPYTYACTYHSKWYFYFCTIRQSIYLLSIVDIHRSYYVSQIDEYFDLIWGKRNQYGQA